MDYHYNKTSATAAAVSGGVDLAMVGASILGKAAKAIEGASKAGKGAAKAIEGASKAGKGAAQAIEGTSKAGKGAVQSEVGTAEKLFEGISGESKNIGSAAKSVTEAVESNPFLKSQTIKAESEKYGIKGRRGFEMKNPSYQKHQNQLETIGGREYSGHALDQMRNRGFFTSVIENAIKTGQKSQSTIDVGCWKFKDIINGVTVIVNKTTGKVVTAY
jgi:hypothetical protein